MNRIYSLILVAFTLAAVAPVAYAADTSSAPVAATDKAVADDAKPAQPAKKAKKAKKAHKKHTGKKHGKKAASGTEAQ